MKRILNGIQILEQQLKIKFSSEQKKVLIHNISSPTLVNSCAGSGKTMLLISSILLRLLLKENKSQNILGITFSKRGAVNMQQRFSLYSNKEYEIPTFLTFHSLFYHLLASISESKSLRVIPSYTKIYFYLAQKLPVAPSLISINQLMQNIFKNYDKLINNGLTYDGLHLRKGANYKQIREGTKIPKLIFGIQKPQFDNDVTFLKDYKAIISSYNEYKQAHNMIDFSDMLTHLWKIINTSPNKLSVLRTKISRFKLVCIDEFQDISLLQWHIIQTLLSNQAKANLLMIGDDDQSIYSFRGSNPKIILKLHKHIKNLQTFNLSTNYRTGGHILQIVKPLITSNHARLPKQLNSLNDKGQVIEYLSNDKRFSANDALLQELLTQIKNPKINDKDIVVLMHFNNSRMILFDWLAKHRCYIKTDSNFLLSNNINYKTLINISIGLVLNRFKYIKKYSRQIGFRPYMHHIDKVLSKVNNINSISEYLKVSRQVNKNHSNHVTHLDKILSIQFKRCQKKINSNKIGKYLFKAYQKLTENHTKYLEKIKFLDKSRYKEINEYLRNSFNRIHSTKDLAKLIKNEDLVKNGKLKNSSINIMSIHQAKGLQFKYVYLYDLNSQIDNDKDIVINHIFSPDIKLSDLLHYLYNTKYQDLQEIEKIMYKDNNSHVFTKLASKMHKLVAMRLTDKLKMFSQIPLMKFHQSTVQAGIEEQVWQLYHNIKNISSAVEEERRLIYVGATRAEDTLYIAYNRNADPLLNELNINQKDKYFLEPNGKVLNNKENEEFLNKLKEV